MSRFADTIFVKFDERKAQTLRERLRPIVAAWGRHPDDLKLLTRSCYLQGLMDGLELARMKPEVLELNS